jgi:hypothetical protein
MGATGTLLGNAVLGLRDNAPQPPVQRFTFADRTAGYVSATAAGTIRPPSVPSLDDNGTNPLMESERRKERQEAARRRQQGRELFTSGLGASGLAETAKKTLLGD